LVHHPTDFRAAMVRLRPELQGLYLSAYQSYLWNAILAGWIADSIPEENRTTLELRMGPAPAPRALDDHQRNEWHAVRIPLPAARWPFPESAPWAAAATRVLGMENLTWDDLKLKGVSKPFFTKGERSAWCVPLKLAATPGPDERHPGQVALHLEVELPRGCYATLIVKRVLSG
jgi:tRNA pseudouridine13 synthase